MNNIFGGYDSAFEQSGQETDSDIEITISDGNMDIELDCWCMTLFVLFAAIQVKCIDKLTQIQTTVSLKMRKGTTYNLLCSCSNLWFAWF